jgi:hypothetical protein
MAKIPDMIAASALTGAEQLELVQSGNTRRATVGDITDGLVASDVGVVVNDHDDDADAPRISAAVNYWRGSVEPNNGEPGDLLYLED